MTPGLRKYPKLAFSAAVLTPRGQKELLAKLRTGSSFMQFDAHRDTVGRGKKQKGIESSAVRPNSGVLPAGRSMRTGYRGHQCC